MKHIKQPAIDTQIEDGRIRTLVEGMLSEIRANGEDAVRKYAADLDGWTSDFALSDEKKQRLIAQVPQQTRDDIGFAFKQISRFAKAQRGSIQDFQIDTEPGVTLGQRCVPVDCAGCYIPGGRYAHVASALMSVATAKAAGVPFVVAASPPRGDAIDPSVAYALDLAGADVILEMGGVQAIASMALGLFGARPADILVGPGNAYVAEAKRQLFGEIGIDVFAGPTESAVIADDTADPMTVAIDLLSQAEHGTNSPVWLFTTSPELSETVARIIPKVAADWPTGEVALTAWENFGEVILCETREEMAAVSDRYACEHLQVQTADLDWWLNRLRNYGSLFLGEGSTVTHGDKCSGTNHILPTRQAARYTGGLNVMKFLKVLTWQEIKTDADPEMSAVASRLSRVEGMDGHARACDWRLQKFGGQTSWDFEVAHQVRYD
ncbi:histidinol dehydrogenase [Litoreibacter roseus]|uniref:Histidinol dehydrogenase homolog n=1 Tax=Litoreibacter roseus TaxID=2601869 RepID=A0A6N6J9V7_9RHOB|nr:histidinol dehydrogenase [Litoreibacter roseus]GFE62975.1 histidinol dehydrogenase [Litoreibacter roseus]